MKRWAMGVIMVGGLFGGMLLPAADFDGNERGEPAIFRRSQCKWVAYGVTNFYFGNSADQVVSDNFDGDAASDAAAYRPSESMWTARGVTRVWFGNTGDTAVAGGRAAGPYDYTVKAGNGADLKQALESDSYSSVFIPVGQYYVGEEIAVDNLGRISGEDMIGTVVNFTAADAGLRLARNYCLVENLTVNGGRGFRVEASQVTVEDCLSINSIGPGFSYAAGAEYPSFLSCRALLSGGPGFANLAWPGGVTSAFANCAGIGCELAGFDGCHNLSNCHVDGQGSMYWGYRLCEGISSALAYDCETGFYQCTDLAACVVEGNGFTISGYVQCSGLSACVADGVTGTEYNDCNLRDGDSCN